MVSGPEKPCYRKIEGLRSVAAEYYPEGIRGSEQSGGLFPGIIDCARRFNRQPGLAHIVFMNAVIETATSGGFGKEVAALSR
jgi:hypothetical protein